MSRKPSVISSAVLAPLRSSSVLMAMVEPCRNRLPSRQSMSALSMVDWMTLTSSPWVDRALPNSSWPLVSSKAAMSVKVPPMSTAMRRWGLGFGGFMGVSGSGGASAAVRRRSGGAVVGADAVAQHAQAGDLDLGHVAFLHVQRRFAAVAHATGGA